MTKLYDKDDPNQVKEDQSPYGDEAVDNDSSPAAMHGRVVRIETNAKHNATTKDIARVEGKIDEAKAESKADKAELKGEIKSGNVELKGKIETVKAELGGKIDTNKAESDGKFAKVYAKLSLVEKLLYVSIAMHVINFAQDSPIIASIVSFIAKLVR